jgi:hypothetical protein
MLLSQRRNNKSKQEYLKNEMKLISFIKYKLVTKF